jgi:hypothetical protein
MSVSEAEVVCLVKAYLEEKFPSSYDVFKEESKSITKNLNVQVPSSLRREWGMFTGHYYYNTQAPPRALRAIIQDYVDLKTEKGTHPH